MIQPRFLKYILLIVTFLLIMPISVKAYNLEDLKEENPLIVKKFAEDQTDPCENNSSALGNVECEESVAWLLQKILNYIRVIGPSLVVVYTAVDFTKVIVSSDNDAMKKAQSKLIKRLVAVALLFVIPTIVIVLLGLIGVSSSDATYGLH